MILPRQTIISAKSPRLPGKNKGFSLVEVVIAIGLASSSMLLILALLPVGLNNVRQAVGQVGEAGVARQVRSDLQQLPLTGTKSIQSLDGQTSYYTQQGIKLPNSTGAYFQATFAVSDPSSKVVGAPTTFNSSAANVTVTLAYPVAVASASQQKKTFSLLEAGQ